MDPGESRWTPTDRIIPDFVRRTPRGSTAFALPTVRNRQVIGSSPIAGSSFPNKITCFASDHVLAQPFDSQSDSLDTPEQCVHVPRGPRRGLLHQVRIRRAEQLTVNGTSAEPSERVDGLRLCRSGRVFALTTAVDTATEINLCLRSTVRALEDRPFTFFRGVFLPLPSSVLPFRIYIFFWHRSEQYSRRPIFRNRRPQLWSAQRRNRSTPVCRSSVMRLKKARSRT